MKVAAGILLLISGFVAPMVMLFWLNGRLSRTPAPRSVEVGLLLALNGVLPVALIISGLGLLTARVGASPVLRIIVTATWLVSALLLLILVASAALRRAGAKDDR